MSFAAVHRDFRRHESERGEAEWQRGPRLPRAEGLESGDDAEALEHELHHQGDAEARAVRAVCATAGAACQARSRSLRVTYALNMRKSCIKV